MTKPNDEQQLLPCPFCNSKYPRLFDDKECFVQCDNCLASTAHMFHNDRLKEVIFRWNHRPPSPRAGLSLEQIETFIHNIITREILQWQVGRKELEIAVSNMVRSYLLDNGKKELAQAIHAAQPKDDGLVEALEKIREIAQSHKIKHGLVPASEIKLESIVVIVEQTISHHEKRKL